MDARLGNRDDALLIRIFPYFAVSPIKTTAKALRVRSQNAKREMKIVAVASGAWRSIAAR
jgi:hypothetical protein